VTDLPILRDIFTAFLSSPVEKLEFNYLSSLLCVIVTNQITCHGLTVIMSQQKEVISKQELVLRQSNALTTAAYSLSRSEKRVVYLALQQCLKTKIDYETAKWGEVAVDIHTSDYLREFTTDNASKEIRSAAESIVKREVVFYEPEESTENEKALTAISWVNGRSHRPKRGVTTFYFNAKLLKTILDIKSDFTRYLISAGELTSPYSMRLYESLMQYNSLKKARFSVSWILERYELPTSYQRMSDFRRRFLKPAIEEISRTTDIYDLDYEESQRNGEKFLTFTWKTHGEKVKGKKLKDLSALEHAHLIHAKIIAQEDVGVDELKILKENMADLMLNGEIICDLALVLIREKLS
jgi:plasmid replication initiation protein